jgi:predicted ATPase
MVTITYSGDKTSANSLKLYVDSVEDTAATKSQSGVFKSGNSSNALRWFSYPPSTAFTLNGALDQTAIWKKELTQAQITKLYNSGNGLSYTSF